MRLLSGLLCCCFLSFASLAGCDFDWSLPSGGGGQGTGGAPGSGNGGAGAGSTSTEGVGAGNDVMSGPDDTVSTGQTFPDCQSCIDAVSLGGRCSEQAAACLSTEGCQELATCVVKCTDDECVQNCSQNVSPEASAAFGEMLACSVCSACVEWCPEYQELCG